MTTTELLQKIARETPRSQIAAEVRDLATRRGVLPGPCERYALLLAKDATTERLPTEEELAELGALALAIDAATARAAAIPAPVKTTATGERIRDSYDWTWPAAGDYDRDTAPLLPAGWKLYSALCLDGYVKLGKPEDWLRLAGKDFGATRDDGRAYVFGIRELDGKARELHAIVPSKQGVTGRREVFPVGELPAACRWCDEQLAEGSAS